MLCFISATVLGSFFPKEVSSADIKFSSSEEDAMLKEEFTQAKSVLRLDADACVAYISDLLESRG